MARPVRPAEAAPLAAGALLLACGALVMQLRPHLMDLPEPRRSPADARERWEDGDRAGAAAEGARDTLLTLMPANLLSWIGRVLMLAGASVVITRLLDRAVGDDGPFDE